MPGQPTTVHNSAPAQLTPWQCAPRLQLTSRQLPSAHSSASIQFRLIQGTPRLHGRTLRVTSVLGFASLHGNTPLLSAPTRLTPRQCIPRLQPTPCHSSAATHIASTPFSASASSLTPTALRLGCRLRELGDLELVPAPALGSLLPEAVDAAVVKDGLEGR